MLHTRQNTFLRSGRHVSPLGAPILGNVIGSHYVLIVAWVSTHLIGIAIFRKKKAEVMKIFLFQTLQTGKIPFFEVFETYFP